VGNSFSFETVLSTVEKLEFLKFTKRQGYFIHAIFVSTENSQINVGRVRNRVSQGGHDVPEGKIFSRYAKSLELMFKLAQISDRADIYDNSQDAPIFVGTKVCGAYCVCDSPPEWVLRYFIEKAKILEIPVGRLESTRTEREDENE
jgi:predicted ABC-type ATPase